MTVDKALLARIQSLEDDAAGRALRQVTLPFVHQVRLRRYWVPHVQHDIAGSIDRSLRRRTQLGELARMSLLILARHSPYTDRIRKEIERPKPLSFQFVTINATIPLIAASIVALQCEVIIQRDKAGGWSFKFKKMALTERGVAVLVKKITALLFKKGG